MKWIVLALAFLFTATPVQAKQALYYCVTGSYSKEIDNDFKKSFHDGWILFGEISQRQLDEPELVYTTDTSKLQIYLYPTGMGKAPALVWMYPNGGSLMCVYYEVFGLYAPERKAKAIAHELCHFYYRLVDQYEGDGRQDIRHDCVMGNFAKWGWTGKFCDDCWKKIEEYYSKGK